MKKILFITILVFISADLLAQQPDHFLTDGTALIKKGKSKEAIKLFTQAIEKDKSNEVYFLKRGEAYADNKQMQEAYEDFSQAIKLNNNYAEAYLKRAVVFTTTDMYRDAINDYDMAVKYAPNDSMKLITLLGRSGVNLATMNYKGAYNDSKAVYDADTNNRKAMINMAMSKMHLDEKPFALEILYKVVRNNPKDTMALQNIGFIYTTMEKFDSALIYLSRALELDAKEPFILSNFAFTQLKLGNSKDAMKNINQSLKILPSNSYAYRNRALIFIEKGDTLSACQDLHTAVKKGFTEMYGNDVRDLIDKHCKIK